jgi:hypothetical protein
MSERETVGWVLYYDPENEGAEGAPWVQRSVDGDDFDWCFFQEATVWPTKKAAKNFRKNQGAPYWRIRRRTRKAKPATLRPTKNVSVAVDSSTVTMPVAIGSVVTFRVERYGLSSISVTQDEI